MQYYFNYGINDPHFNGFSEGERFVRARDKEEALGKLEEQFPELKCWDFDWENMPGSSGPDSMVKPLYFEKDGMPTPTLLNFGFGYCGYHYEGADAIEHARRANATPVWEPGPTASSKEIRKEQREYIERYSDRLGLDGGRNVEDVWHFEGPSESQIQSRDDRPD